MSASASEERRVRNKTRRSERRVAAHTLTKARLICGGCLQRREFWEESVKETLKKTQ